jgi:NAD(P)-dependent dehydrogenase (short-subunit alcohol dehydrogenase family)
LNGGYGAAQAAKEALTRDLSAELAPQGIRVVGLRPHGMPQTPSLKEVYDAKAKGSGMTWEQWQEYLASTTHARRVMVSRVTNPGRGVSVGLLVKGASRGPFFWFFC